MLLLRYQGSVWSPLQARPLPSSAGSRCVQLAGEAGKGLGAKATSRIPVETLRQINRGLGRTVITKYGTKRGAIALGRALPLGIGATIGAGANYALTRAIARQADSFFTHLAPPEPAGDHNRVE